MERSWLSYAKEASFLPVASFIVIVRALDELRKYFDFSLAHPDITHWRPQLRNWCNEGRIRSLEKSPPFLESRFSRSFFSDPLFFFVGENRKWGHFPGSLRLHFIRDPSRSAIYLLFYRRNLEKLPQVIDSDSPENGTAICYFSADSRDRLSQKSISRRFRGQKGFCLTRLIPLKVRISCMPPSPALNAHEVYICNWVWPTKALMLQSICFPSTDSMHWKDRPGREIEEAGIVERGFLPFGKKGSFLFASFLALWTSSYASASRYNAFPRANITHSGIVLRVFFAFSTF